MVLKDKGDSARPLCAKGGVVWFVDGRGCHAGQELVGTGSAHTILLHSTTTAPIFAYLHHPSMINTDRPGTGSW